MHHKLQQIKRVCRINKCNVFPREQLEYLMLENVGWSLDSGIDWIVGVTLPTRIEPDGCW